MDFPSPLPIMQIASWIEAEIIGDANGQANGINEIHKVRQGDITFVDVEKYFKKSLSSAATFIIINKRIEAPLGKTLLYCKNPFEAYDYVIRQFRPPSSISEQISKDAVIGSSTVVEPGAVIGPDVVIGNNCHIQANAVIMPHTKIGDHVIIQPGAIVGSDAFYFKKENGTYKKWTSGGRVILENFVQIGAGCTINKGVSGDTVVGEGTKLDCLVHVGHGVEIGKNCLIAAQVGIGGKTVIGNRVTLYGQVGVAHNLVIGDDVIVYAKSGIAKDLEPGKVYFGSPAEEAKKMFRQLATLKKLRGD